MYTTYSLCQKKRTFNSKFLAMSGYPVRYDLWNPPLQPLHHYLPSHHSMQRDLHSGSKEAHLGKFFFAEECRLINFVLYFILTLSGSPDLDPGFQGKPMNLWCVWDWVHTNHLHSGEGIMEGTTLPYNSHPFLFIFCFTSLKACISMMEIRLWLLWPWIL